jgi:hypothetical protein
MGHSTSHFDNDMFIHWEVFRLDWKSHHDRCDMISCYPFRNGVDGIRRRNPLKNVLSHDFGFSGSWSRILGFSDPDLLLIAIQRAILRIEDSLRSWIVLAFSDNVLDRNR